MAAVAMLGTVLGLPLVTGINLYATVLTVGLLQRFGLVELPPQFDVFASWWIIGIAGFLYLVEFVADKVPWVDSAWDTVHTFIRPVAGAVLALVAVGEVHPVVQVGAVLLGGSLALASHSTKASARLAANTSPEPVTNWGLSVAEDVVAVSGAWLALVHPVIMLLLVIIFLVGFVVCLRKVYQGVAALLRRGRRRLQRGTAQAG